MKVRRMVVKERIKVTGRRGMEMMEELMKMTTMLMTINQEEMTRNHVSLKQNVLTDSPTHTRSLPLLHRLSQYRTYLVQYLLSYRL